MSDIKLILDHVLSDEKLLNSSAFRERVYKDEPIIRPASQLKALSTPKKIKEMKEIVYSPEAYWKTSAWLFYTQGKCAEDYEDSYEYNTDFTKYYPCYRDLSLEQLRGYFTWRKKVRNGNIVKAPLPFVYIYIYELINCIGSKTTLECFLKLKNFFDSYTYIDDSIKKYSENWLIDFIVYYGLDPELANDMPDVMHDSALLSLMHWDKCSDDELFEAISKLSSYQFEKSLYYLSKPDEFKAVLVRSFIGISAFFHEKRKQSFFSKLFGNTVECSYNMFRSAIFYDRQSMRSCEYALNEIHTYTCKNGKWSCQKIYGSRGRSVRLGNLVRAVDSLLREKSDFKHKISFEDVSKTAVKLIRNVIDEYFEELRRKEARKITIDLSKLSGIRKAADITREKLLVDENGETDDIITQTEENTKSEPITEDCPLDRSEKEFLISLLYNGDYRGISAKYRIMPSILADSVNEKMFDLFSDNIIDFSEDIPNIIEDYADDLKEMFHKE
ncbi:TerB N-terminal domain-containing protein [uncultured Ruminococcus sp.]|uniref:TerB N-terminal domain-containing protein n=1 Tax=uncultured Ruminococcus sp. TaxID=165186 RepID=UPI0025D7B714|nr:TerB N-terminal domain-containing protein [uncultured Ruminococcus sp.]